MSDSDGDLYSRLLSSSRQAITGRHYEAAYHALAAALHCAQDMRDVDRLEEVAKEAVKQLDHINSTAPNSVMSSKSASERINGVDMYDILGQVAHTRARMIKEDKRLDNTMPSRRTSGSS